MKLDTNFIGEVRNSFKKTTDSNFKKLLFLVFCAFVLALFLGFVFGTYDEPFSLYGFYVMCFIFLFITVITEPSKQKIHEKEEAKILKKIASDNNGVYNEVVDLKKEKSAMFRQGGSRFASKEVSFRNDSGEEVRFFDYFFVIKPDDKNPERHFYKVFVISGIGSVPHMYLNYKRDIYSMSLGQKLSLPSDFEKEFELSVPPSYHLEALQVFTPDIIHEILESPLRCDIEFVDDKIFFFFKTKINIYKDYENLDNQIGSALHIADLLRPKFENLRWSQVGDKSYYM